MKMIIGVLKESLPGERRVAATPDSVKKLIKLGYQVVVESNCGSDANFPNSGYEDAGAEVERNTQSVLDRADVLIKVNEPTLSEIEEISSGTTLVSFVWPAKNEEQIERLRARNITTLAMDCVPRISRAQKLDALSSMANIAGYRAIIEAAGDFGSFFTGQITAAGKVPPAKVLVIGAGVAGLAAIGTAKSLGAIVRAFDTRLAVKDQVKSMGADFLELEFEESGEGEGGYAKTMSEEFIAAEMELFAQQAKEVDIIVTTALIPGKPAPVLITREMVKSMKPGSVVVDLAAQNGGNCEMTQPGEKIVTHDVTVIGYTDLPSRLPTQSSSLYANNVVNLLTDMTPEKDGQLNIDVEDQVVRGCLVTRAGETMWPPPKIENPSPPPAKVVAKQEPVEAASAAPVSDATSKMIWTIVGSALMLLFLWLVGRYAPAEFVQHFTVFILACFVGWQLVWNVTPALHTPLMSVTNAISGIILIGGMLQMGIGGGWLSMPTLLAALAVLIATINVVGGFLVTQRMLSMFRKQS
jgi:NAD(P) transhydrogenase subunit alpha